MKISKINARQIIDSRGNPTVEAEVILESGSTGRAAVPSGASTGKHEAHELRDGSKSYNGNSVTKAVNNVNTEVFNNLKGNRADDQYLIDETMIKLDGTPNKARLGANAILSVSLACAHAAAKERKIPLYKQINDIAHNPNMSMPMPMMNVLNGGKHANSSSDFQEFMIMPVGSKSIVEAVKTGSEIFHTLKKEIANNGMSTAVGDEGGFSIPIIESNSQMLDFLQKATVKTGYEPGRDVVFALDVAASEFYVNGSYQLKVENRNIDTREMVIYLKDLSEKYPIFSIEDGLAEDDWDGWKLLIEQMMNRQIVGDDLLVTNTKRIKKAIDLQCANALLVKPNQIGTLTETIKAIKLAKDHGWNTIVSHRSGETEDITIAHLAVGTGAGQIKTGSMSRGERTAKYNELIRIESSDKSLNFFNPLF